MTVTLIIIAVLAFLGWISVTIVAKSAIHQIQSYVLLLIGVVALSGAFVVDILKDILKAIKSQQQ